MRKILIWMMLLCMLSGAAAADELSEAACGLARRMDALADNDAYLKALSVSDDVIGMAQKLGAGDRETHTMMVSVDLSAVKSMMLNMLAGETGLSDPVAQEAIMSRMNAALIQQAVAARGTLALAAASMLSTGDFFACDREPGDGMFLIFYGQYSPVAVTWVAKNGAVSMSGIFVPVEELSGCTTADEVANWFAAMGMDGAVVTPVE